MAKQTNSGLKLTRAGIVAAARRIIEDEGVDALSMRKLAGVLGSSPMAIYHHVQGRADLLIAVLNDLTAELPRPELPEAPLDRMVFAAQYTHNSMVELPWIIEVIQSNVAFGRGAMWTVDTFLSAGAELGLTDEQVLHLYGTVWRFIVGDVFERSRDARAAAAAAGSSEESVWHERIANEDLSDIPTFARVRTNWGVCRSTYSARDQLAGIVRAGAAAPVS